MSFREIELKVLRLTIFLVEEKVEVLFLLFLLDYCS